MNTPRPVPADVLNRQIAASDPLVSAWVAANAGSGKTHVLAQRVIRLLLDGCAPSRILCLTFTKAAAANMAKRVFDTLARWTALDDAALDAELRQIGIKKIDAARRDRKSTRLNSSHQIISYAVFCLKKKKKQKKTTYQQKQKKNKTKIK